MWAAILDRATRLIRDKFSDCRVVLHPDQASYVCKGIFHAPHAELLTDGEGGVAVSSMDPVVDVRLADLPVVPKTKDVLTIELMQPDGGFGPARRYRIKDTQDDGYGGVKLALVKGG